MKQREIPPATITEPPPEPKVPRNVFSPSLSLMDINDEELARQLTLMEFETFRAIRVRTHHRTRARSGGIGWGSLPLVLAVCSPRSCSTRFGTNQSNDIGT
jgi:hypothetical protein